MRFLFLLIFISVSLEAPFVKDDQDFFEDARPVRKRVSRIPSPVSNLDDSDSSGRVRPVRKHSPTYTSSSTSATSEGSKRRSERRKKSLQSVEDLLRDSDSSASSSSETDSYSSFKTAKSHESPRSGRSRSPSRSRSRSLLRDPDLNKEAKEARARHGLKMLARRAGASASHEGLSEDPRSAQKSHVQIAEPRGRRSSSFSSESSSDTGSYSSFDTDGYETATSEVDNFPTMEGKDATYRMPKIPHNSKLDKNYLKELRKNHRDRQKAKREEARRAAEIRHRRLAITVDQRENPLDNHLTSRERPFILAPDADSFVIPPREGVDRLIEQARSALPRENTGLFIVPTLDLGETE